MLTRIVTVGASQDAARARAALEGLSGVLAADLLADGRSIRMHQGDRLTQGDVIAALEKAGISGAHIH